ncbi:carboxylesterase family protein [Gammaproteobacteria bacterium]|nr:carboxylesterase family protein [Gammaproteobacteria bacterium]
MSPSAKGLTGLRAITSEETLEASEKVFANQFLDVVVDGTTLVEPIRQSIRHSRSSLVDLLIGSNLDEWRSYLPATGSIENTQDLRFSLPDWKKVQDRFASSDNPLGALVQLVTASNYVCPSKAMTDTLKQKQQKYGVTSSLNTVMVNCHLQRARIKELSNLIFFNTHADWLPTDVEDRLLSQRMMSYWISFARDGDPNVEGEHVWPAHIAQIRTSRELYRESEVLVLGSKLYTSHHPSDPLCRIDGIAPVFD